MAAKLLCPEAALRTNHLNLIRLSLAVGVLFSHCFPLASSAASEPLDWLTRGKTTIGGVCVEFFFAISGFLIVRSWIGSRSLADYMEKRVLRIYPAFIVFALAGSVLALSSAAEVSASLANMDWKSVPLSLLRLQNPISDAGTYPGNPHPGVNGSLWTIPLEFLAYLLVAAFGLLTRFRSKSLWITACAALYAVFVFQLFRGHASGWQFKEAFPRYATFFAVGGSFYLFRNAIPRSRLLLAASIATIVLTAAWTGPAFDMLFPFAAPYGLFYLAFSRPAGLDRILAGRDLSYGTYLASFPVQQALVFYWHLAHPLALFLAALPIVLGVAFLSWEGIERRCLAIKHRRMPGTVPTHEPSAT